MVGIYKITSPSKKVYIGQSINILNRWNSYKLKGCPKQIKLHNSLVKYGYDSHLFEVSHELPKEISQEILNNYESIYLDFYKELGIEVLNIKNAGSNGKHSLETQECQIN